MSITFTTRWLYRSQMKKLFVLIIEAHNFFKTKRHIFHPGPVLPPSWWWLPIWSPETHKSTITYFEFRSPRPKCFQWACSTESSGLIAEALLNGFLSSMVQRSKNKSLSSDIELLSSWLFAFRFVCWRRRELTIQETKTKFYAFGTSANLFLALCEIRRSCLQRIFMQVIDLHNCGRPTNV